MQQEIAVLEIDMRGQVCPSTLLIALREMNAHCEELRAGTAVLLFRTDNRAATHTIPDSASHMGYEVQVSKEGGHYVILVARKERDDPF